MEKGSAGILACHPTLAPGGLPATSFGVIGV